MAIKILWFEVNNPMKWSMWKKLAVLFAFLALISVFLPWMSWTIAGESDSASALEENESWGAAGWVVLIFAFLGLVSLFLKERPVKNINNKAYTMLCGLIILIVSVVALVSTSDDVAEINEVGEYLGLVGVEMEFSVGYGIYLALISGLLFLLFGFLIWRESGESLIVTGEAAAPAQPSPEKAEVTAEAAEVAEPAEGAPITAEKVAETEEPVEAVPEAAEPTEVPPVTVAETAEAVEEEPELVPIESELEPAVAPVEEGTEEEKTLRRWARHINQDGETFEQCMACNEYGFLKAEETGSYYTFKCTNCGADFTLKK